MTDLTIDLLQKMAALFAQYENEHFEPRLYGVNDGKAIGTYLEQKFTALLAQSFDFQIGNSASGIDLPSVDVDIKTTSIKQPQSSCPFKSARQKIYGLGYHLLVFVYDKLDVHEGRTSRLNILHAIFIDREHTADFTMTRGLARIIADDGDVEDVAAYLLDRNLPLDEIAAHELAREILRNPPLEGYLTISNALQWRLQYGRAILQAGQVPGLKRIV